jgi:hypothetical protein
VAFNLAYCDIGDRDDYRGQIERFAGGRFGATPTADEAATPSNAAELLSNSIVKPVA